VSDLPEFFRRIAASAASNMDLALDLARAGVAVFPVHPGGPEAKRPYSGVYWLSQSTTQEARIKAWWHQWPDAMPAIDLVKAGLYVVDADRHGGPDGVAAWGLLMDENGFDPSACPVVRTPSEGQHYYFRNRKPPLGGSRGRLPQAVDIRGARQYVVAPGATMTDGRRYELVDGWILDAPEIPDWLVDLVSSKGEAPPEPAPVERPAASHARDASATDTRLTAYAESALDDEAHKVASAAKGMRNTALHNSAFAMGTIVASGWISESTVRARLMGAASDSGLVRDDGPGAAAKTFASGMRAGRQRPREIPEELEGPELGFGASMAAALVASSREIVDPETGEVHDEIPPAPLPRRPEERELSEEWTHIPGLVGEIVDWITDTARRPNRGLALGAALAIVGTAAGRQFAGPTLTGTHLYVIGLAKTGAGKDHALKQIGAILHAAKLGHYRGPSEFISMPAVINFLVKKPLSVCAMDEFGAFLKRINSRKASGFEASISKILRTVWGASFASMMTPEWAGKEAAEIHAPAVSIYGVSTHGEFYSALEGADQDNGLLNRFLMIETHTRPRDVDPKLDPLTVPEHIVEGIRRIHNASGDLQAASRGASDEIPVPIRLQWGNGAKSLYEALSRHVEDLIDSDEATGRHYARTAEIAQRIGAIIAVGRGSEVLTAEDMLLGRGIALWSAETMARGAAEHISDSESQATAINVLRVLAERGGRVSHRDLTRALKHRYGVRELKEALVSLSDAGQVHVGKDAPARGGPPTIWYQAAQ
jgi:hypothetical protein